MAELLEYIVRLRGAQVAAAEVRGLRSEFVKLGATQAEVNSASAASAAEAAGARRAAAIGLVTKASKVGALALAGVAFEAVKLSNTFDTEMLKVQTQAGAGHDEMVKMKGAVIDLATSGKSMGEGPTSLAMGLYHLESLGIRGARALHALTLASQASAISGADLEETTSALGAAYFIGIKGAGGLDHIMALLNATVGQGNMRMSELVHALGTGVLPSAKVAGLGITDVMAALALFADSGMNASGAAAQFATALHFLYNPTTKAQAALAQLGLAPDALAKDLRKPNGMITALRDLRDHLSGLSKINQEQLLGQMLPGGRGRILLTQLEMLDRSQRKFDAINKQATSANWKAAVEAQKRNPATMLSIAWAKLQGDLVKFGHAVGPVLVPVLIGITTVLSTMLAVFAKFPAIPVVLFVGLLVLGFIALGRSIGGAMVSLVRYALGMPAVVAETEAATVATTEFAVANDAAAATTGGLISKIALLRLGLGGLAAALAVGGFEVLTRGLGNFFGNVGDGFAASDTDPTVRRARAQGHRLHKSIAIFDRSHPLRSDTLSRADIVRLLHEGDPGLVPGAPGIPRNYHPGHPYYGPIPLMAMGGVVRAAGAAVVGDAGPELLDLPAGAKVTPLRGRGGGGAGWQGGDIVLQVSGREIARVLRREILEAQARG